MIAGAAGWGGGLQDKIREALERSGSVIHTGYVADEDLPALYSGCAFSVYPSLYEGFGLPVLESMKCGRFCLTSKVSSMPEIVGEELPMVDPEDVECIAEGMMKIANDPDLLEDLGRKALARADLFDWQVCYERTMTLIREGVDSP